MVNKVTYEQEPNLFDDITEYSIEEIVDHRKGSTFYREAIIEFKEEDKKYFTQVKNFEQYLGTWKTNDVIWSEDDGFDTEFSILTRVEKKETVSYTWEEV